MHARTFALFFIGTALAWGVWPSLAVAKLIVPAMVSLSDISFSATPPKQGDTMYLSGRVSSYYPFVVQDIRETLLDADENPIGDPIEYDPSLLTVPTASSTYATFTQLPFPLIESVPGEITAASFFKIDISLASLYGDPFSTGSLIVPVPKPKVSNVLFLPGIEGSRLYEGTGCGKSAEEKLWEPIGDSLFSILRGAGDEKVRNLFLDSAGESVCGDIYAKENDIIDSVRGNAMYQAFIDEMNGLKADGTIADWKPVAYDWRLSLDDLLHKGAERDGNIYYEEETDTPYIEQTLRALAASSRTGKVTIVAHSNGGLLAKALLNQLGGSAAELVDKVIMVGAPQSGAPEDVGSLLVGYDTGIYKYGFPIVSDTAAQALAQNSPMAYHLLPSENYFDSVASDANHPIVSFAGDGYAKEISAYGTTITNSSSLDDFLRASSLNSTLIDYANREHTTLDNWTPPDGIEVDQIAGWGADTVAGIDFYTPQLADALTAVEAPRAYRPIFTEDGDGIVPVPSALMMPSSTGVNRYWLNLDLYYKATKIKRIHRDIFEVPSLEDFIKNIIENNTSTLPDYISTIQPAPLTESKKLIFFLHSPLTLQLTDSLGNVTGLAPDDSITQDIPDSTYGEFGEVKCVTVPEGGNYQLTMRGQDNGTFSLDIQETTGDVITASSTIASVPTTASTLATLTISNGIDTASALTVDENGDGSNIITLVPKLGETVNYVPLPSTDSGSSEPVNPAPRPTPATVSVSSGSISPIIASGPDISTTTATTTQTVITSTTGTIIATRVVKKGKRIAVAPPKKVTATTPQTASVYQASQQPAVKSIGARVYNGLYSFWVALKKLF